MAKRGDGFGRWTVRWLALLGVVLVVLGTFGWWLSTRVIDAEGFADVAAKASQRDLDELMTMGATATISKPFSPKELPEQLREIWKKLP